MCYYCMDKGGVRYYKKGIEPFPNEEYEFIAACSCDAGTKYGDWPRIDNLVSEGVLGWLWDKNESRHKKINNDDVQRAKAIVSRFLK